METTVVSVMYLYCLVVRFTFVLTILLQHTLQYPLSWKVPNKKPTLACKTDFSSYSTNLNKMWRVEGHHARFKTRSQDLEIRGAFGRRNIEFETSCRPRRPSTVEHQKFESALIIRDHPRSRRRQRLRLVQKSRQKTLLIVKSGIFGPT